MPFAGTACMSWVSKASPSLQRGPGRKPHCFPPPPLQGSLKRPENKARCLLAISKGSSCSETAGHLKEKNYPAQVLLLHLGNSHSLNSLQLCLTPAGWSSRVTFNRQHQLLRCENRNFRILRTDPERGLNWERRLERREGGIWAGRGDDSPTIRRPVKTNAQWGALEWAGWAREASMLGEGGCVRQMHLEQEEPWSPISPLHLQWAPTSQRTSPKQIWEKDIPQTQWPCL
jgi:hypothetical protein